VEADEVDTRLRHQGGQAGDEVQRFQDEMDRTSRQILFALKLDISLFRYELHHGVRIVFVELR